MLVRHRRKSGGRNLYSGSGSIDISGVARSECEAWEDPDGTCFFARLKCNVGKKYTGYSYIIETHPDPANDHGVLKWGLAYDATLDNPDDKPKFSKVPKAMGRAIIFLQGYLAGGPQSQQKVYIEAAKVGISESTLRRARFGIADTLKDQPGKPWFLLGPDDPPPLVPPPPSP